MLSNGTPMRDPISAAWNAVARLNDYESAQRAVALTGTRSESWHGVNR